MRFLNGIDFIILALNDDRYLIRPITVMGIFTAITSIFFLPLIGVFFVPVSGWVLAALVAGFWLVLVIRKLVRIGLAWFSFWLDQRELDREPEHSEITSEWSD